MDNNKKKLAIVVSHPIQHFCPQYASFSKIKGLEVKLFFASALGFKKYKDKNFGQEIAWTNLRLEEFNHVFLNGEQVLPSGKELDAPTLDNELDTFKPDAIISYGYFQKFQRRAHHWANKNNIPVAFISDSENRQNRDWWKRLAKYFYLNWYYKKINYFFTVGNANEEYYRLYGAPSENFIRMHFPIDIECYRQAYEKKETLRASIREKYNIKKDEFVISVVGKLVEWKNQDHLIDLLAKLETLGKKAHIFIIGTGKMLEVWKDKAKTLKQNNVHFTGFIDPVFLPEYYAASDLYIHPASIEPHSLAISEALYMGCPIVISDRCGSYGEDDDVQHGKNGYVYKFGDIDGLSKIVINLMEDKLLLEKLGEYSHAISVKFQNRSHQECVKELLQKVGAN